MCVAIFLPFSERFTVSGRFLACTVAGCGLARLADVRSWHAQAIGQFVGHLEISLVGPFSDLLYLDLLERRQELRANRQTKLGRSHRQPKARRRQPRNPRSPQG